MKKLFFALLMPLLTVFLLSACSEKPGAAASSVSESQSSSVSAESPSAPSGTQASSSPVSSAPSSSAVPSSAAPASSSARSSSSSSFRVSVAMVTVSIDGTNDKTDGGGKCSFRTELKAGDSVFSIMKSLKQEGKISLSYEKEIAGIYIDSINNWACGSGSQGWIYRVDGGNPPQTGCDRYTSLHNGSVIEWKYTLDGSWK